MAKNKFSDSFMIAETPKANKVVWIKHPEISPKTVAKPNFLPFTILCVKTNILSGPGEIAKIEVANAKDKRVSVIKVKIHFFLHPMETESIVPFVFHSFIFSVLEMGFLSINLKITTKVILFYISVKKLNKNKFLTLKYIIFVE